MFGGEYPGGALYTKADFIEKNPKITQALTNAVLKTLKWIEQHAGRIWQRCRPSWSAPTRRSISRR